MSNRNWELIAKYLSGNLSKEEENELFIWMKASYDNEVIFKQAQKAWNSSLKKKEFNPDTLKAWEDLKEKLLAQPEVKVVSINSYATKRYYYAAAAAILLIIGIGYLLRLNSTNTSDFSQSLATTDQMELYYLPDSTLIWLNKNSKLSYSDNFKEDRQVKLTGEAYFEVRRDPSRPFIIHTENTVTKVLGTTFNLRAVKGEKDEQIVVTSGEVEFGSKENEGSKQLLHKDDKGMLGKGEKEVKKMKNDNQSFLAWRNDKEQIKNTLKYKDEKAPLKYLDTDFEWKANIVKQVVLEGNIINTSIFTSYKDVKLRVAYVDKLTNKTAEEHFVIHKAIAPGSFVKYKYRLGNWFDGAENIKVEIEEAKVSEK
jgi:transmembrane sensor